MEHAAVHFSLLFGSGRGDPRRRIRPPPTPAECRQLTYFQGTPEENGLDVVFDFVGDTDEIGFEAGFQAALMIRPLLVASGDVADECVEMSLELVADPRFVEGELPFTSRLVISESLAAAPGDTFESSLLQFVIEPELELRHVVVRALMRSVSGAWRSEVSVHITDGDGIQPCDSYPALPQAGGSFLRQVVGTVELDESPDQCSLEELLVRFVPETIIEGCDVPVLYPRELFSIDCELSPRRIPPSARGFITYNPQTELFSDGGLFGPAPDCCDE